MTHASNDQLIELCKQAVERRICYSAGELVHYDTLVPKGDGIYSIRPGAIPGKDWFIQYIADEEPKVLSSEELFQILTKAL